MTPWFRRSPYGLTAAEAAAVTLAQADAYLMDWVREAEQSR